MKANSGLILTPDQPGFWETFRAALRSERGTLAGDSILVTPGSGATVATHTVSSKEHQVVMVASESGHILKSLPSYSWWVPTAAVGAGKLYADLFNASGSGKIINIHGIWCIVDTDTGLTGALGIQIMLLRTSAVGTGGTAPTYNGGSAETTGTIVPFDTANAALPAQITARALPTGGATIAAFWWSQFVVGEEAATSMAYIASFQNMIPVGLNIQELTLREGQGILYKQGPVAATGNVSFLTVFTLE